MPINYKKYPPNWLSEIRPRILARAKNKCEFPGCDFKNGEWVWAVKNGNKSSWFRDYDEAMKQPMTFERKNGKDVPNPKRVKVVLTIAHLHHDETNWDVKDEDLCAMCQLHHCRYDAKEKYRKKGHAKELLSQAIKSIRDQGVKGKIEIQASPRERSISKKNLVDFYERMNLFVTNK